MKGATRPQTYTAAEVARLFGIGINQAYRALKNGEIPSVRVGKSIRGLKRPIDRILDLDPGAPDRQAQPAA